jgi:type II secretory pathway pseudopilin PulG
MGKIKKRAGFTLIEVIVALGIFMIVVLALLSSYYSYYRAVKDLRYKSIGQNLAQLQLEDLKNLPIEAIKSLVDGKSFLPNYPEDKNTVDPSNPSVYDSGKLSGEFVMASLGNVCGTDATVSSPDNLLLDYLPSSIEITKYSIYDEGPPVIYTYFYKLTLHKEVYPHYQKLIKITDLAPSNNDIAKKIYEIEVTVFWGPEDNEKSITLKTEKGYE